MSFLSLLNHRCDLYELTATDSYGSPVFTYTKVNSTPVRCRLDLSFLRSGKDNLWVEASAKPTDRVGVMMFLPNAPIKSGMRAMVTHGPKGVFQLQGAIDEAWDFDSLDHFEVGVAEVSSLQWRAPVTGG